MVTIDIKNKINEDKELLPEEIDLIKDVAEKGDNNAQELLGDYYLNRDIDVARDWYRKAKDANVEALFKLGNTFKQNGTLMEQEFSYAYFIEAANKGHVEAQYRVSIAFQNGYGVKKNLDAAFIWLKSAAEKGHCEAQYQIAVKYEKGLTIKKSFEEALLWYKKAAEQKQVDALFRLGKIYFDGVLVEKSLQQSAFYFEEAAKLNHKKACLYLAGFYEKGEYVDFSLEKASELYSTYLKEYDDKDAEKKYKKVSKRLSRLMKNRYKIESIEAKFDDFIYTDKFERISKRYIRQQENYDHKGFIHEKDYEFSKETENVGIKEKYLKKAVKNYNALAIKALIEMYDKNNKKKVKKLYIRLAKCKYKESLEACEWLINYYEKKSKYLITRIIARYYFTLREVIKSQEK